MHRINESKNVNKIKANARKLGVELANHGKDFNMSEIVKKHSLEYANRAKIAYEEKKEEIANQYNNDKDAIDAYYACKKGSSYGRVFMHRALKENPLIKDWESLTTNQTAKYKSLYSNRIELFDKFKEGFIDACKIAYINYQQNSTTNSKKRKAESELDESRSKQLRLTEERSSPSPISVAEPSDIKAYEAEVVEVESDSNGQVMSEIIFKDKQEPHAAIPPTYVVNNSSLFFNVPTAQPMQNVVPSIEMQQQLYMWQQYQLQQYLQQQQALAQLSYFPKW